MMSAHQLDKNVKIEATCDATVGKFKRTVRLYFYFHLLSGLIASSATLFFIFTLINQPKSLLLAISLGMVILSVFSYIVLKLFFESQKPEQFLSLKNAFYSEILSHLPKILPPQEQSLSIANASYKVSSKLAEQEYDFFTLFPKMKTLSKILRKISSRFFFNDLIQARELFLILSIEEHIRIVKKYPTDLEIHASIAHAYLALSRLYEDAAKKMVSNNPLYSAITHKFTKSTQSAIEEFQIIDHYAPNDPWVHAQLASCHHALEDFEKELEEYEKILALCPQDREIMHRLGILYFKLGKSAKGLSIYEYLKRVGYPKANEVINYYDAPLRTSYEGTT